MNYTEIVRSTPVVMVEFFASWCPHCKRMAPIVDQIRELLGGMADIYSFDIDENRELADEQNVESIPVFIVYRDGQEVWRHVGEIEAPALLAKIESFLK